MIAKLERTLSTAKTKQGPNTEPLQTLGSSSKQCINTATGGLAIDYVVVKNTEQKLFSLHGKSLRKLLITVIFLGESWHIAMIKTEANISNLYQSGHLFKQVVAISIITCLSYFSEKNLLWSC